MWGEGDTKKDNDSVGPRMLGQVYCYQRKVGVYKSDISAVLKKVSDSGFTLNGEYRNSTTSSELVSLSKIPEGLSRGNCCSPSNFLFYFRSSIRFATHGGSFSLAVQDITTKKEMVAKDGKNISDWPG